MHNLRQPVKQVYSEQEAANALGVSLTTLHSILDKHIFNDGAHKPERFELLLSDVLLCSYWLEESRDQKVVTIGR